MFLFNRALIILQATLRRVSLLSCGIIFVEVIIVLLKDLLVCNKNWDDQTSLVIVDRDQKEPQYLRLRFVRALFGDRQVCWFRDDVVILI